jgi:hypothetical protein
VLRGCLHRGVGWHCGHTCWQSRSRQGRRRSCTAGGGTGGGGGGGGARQGGARGAWLHVGPPEHTADQDQGLLTPSKQGPLPAAGVGGNAPSTGEGAPPSPPIPVDALDLAFKASGCARRTELAPGRALGAATLALAASSWRVALGAGRVALRAVEARLPASSALVACGPGRGLGWAKRGQGGGTRHIKGSASSRCRQFSSSQPAPW